MTRIDGRYDDGDVDAYFQPSAIWNMRVQDVEPAHAARLLDPVWFPKPATGKRVQSFGFSLFKWLKLNSSISTRIRSMAAGTVRWWDYLAGRNLPADISRTLSRMIFHWSWRICARPQGTIMTSAPLPRQPKPPGAMLRVSPRLSGAAFFLAPTNGRIGAPRPI
jgi:hypothetical protein